VALERLGGRVHAVHRAEPTRRAITLVDSAGERTITVLGERLAANGSDDLAWDELASADAVYFTAGDAEALRRAREAKALVATARVLPLLAASGVALDALVGSANDSSEAFSETDVVPRPRLCVWTDGGNGGAFLHDGRRDRYDPAPAPPVVDRYGAGDSFAAGLTFGLGAGLSVDDALRVAARCGAAAIGGAGPYSTQLHGSEL
jgi:ribokinase